MNDRVVPINKKEPDKSLTKRKGKSPDSSDKPLEPPVDSFAEAITDNFTHQSDSGKRKATVANLKFLLDHYKIEISYDELLKEQSIKLNNKNLDKGHCDLIANSNIAHIKSLMALNGLPVSCFDLLSALFAEKTKNPIVEFIKSEEWDGKDRINALFKTLTVSEHDAEYVFLALKTWLIQCVAAADGAKSSPNELALAKFELIFILQGGQGVKKTSWFRRLLPKKLARYIVDGAHLDPADKETVRIAISSWICELGELDSTFKRADISRLKAFLSKLIDTIRLPYDRAASDFGRRTSFCASVNPESFLVDTTGARRFLPVQVLACDSLHSIDMQQLWAQVWQLYLSGEQWWCSKELEQLLEERHARRLSENTTHDQ